MTITKWMYPDPTTLRKEYANKMYIQYQEKRIALEDLYLNY
jgi:hypothetical protein